MTTASLAAQEFNQTWPAFIHVMEAALEKPTFETCLKNAKAEKLENDCLTIKVPNEFAKDRLESKYKELITQTLRNIMNKSSLKVDFVPSMDNPKTEAVEKITPYEGDFSYPKEEYEGIKLNPKYSFDTFVVGNNNNIAATAALTVSRTPGKAYNPLFIYGGVGLGKTHLMQAIGHNVLALNKKAKVVYVSAERFTNEMIVSIKTNGMPQFRKKYRHVDLLLIDDIQFFMDKERVQEEFFHTFNELHEANKQIVFTSDRLPRDIPNIEDRLRTRFEWGLTTDIQKPDLETRQAILLKKADLENVLLPNDVAAYIAEKIPSNIRELEGALLRVIFYASIHNEPLSLETTITALKDIIPDSKPRPLSVEDIQTKVSEYFNIKIEDLLSEKRDKNFAYPRQIAMYIARECTNFSYPDIAKKFNRDHTTILHAYEKISQSMYDSSIKNSIENIKNQLKS